LLFSSFSRSGGAAAGSGDGDRSSGADAPLFFQQLGQFSGFEDGQLGQVFDEFGRSAMVVFLRRIGFREFLQR
jgi:hypothetical protein